MNLFGLGSQLLSMGSSNLLSFQSVFQSNVASVIDNSAAQRNLNDIQKKIKELQEYSRKNLEQLQNTLTQSNNYVAHNQNHNIIDTNSLVPGIGFGAFNVPTPPRYNIYREMEELKAQHNFQEQNFLKEISNETKIKKALIFQNNHYEFDEGGNPIKDPNTNNPILYSGGETDLQKAYRNKFENKKEQDLYKKQNQEINKINDESAAFINKMATDPTNFTDPEKLKKMQLKIKEFEKREKEIYLHHEKEKNNLNCGFLPDPHNPQNKIESFVEQKTLQYTNIVNEHKQEQQNSPQYKAILKYIEDLNKFSKRQREMLSNYKKEQFDPNALLKFKKKMGL